MLKSVILFVLCAVCALLAENYFSGGRIVEEDEDGFRHFVFFHSARAVIDGNGWTRILVPALAVGVVRYLTVKFAVSWLFWVALFAFVVLGAYYFWWYLRDGDRLRELIPFLPIFIVISRQLTRVGAKIAPTLTSKLGVAAFSLLPKLAWLAFGILVIVCLWRKWRESRNSLYRVIAIILVIALLVGMIFSVVDAFKGIKPATAGKSTQQITETSPWYYFYNTDLQYDNTGENDYNFGVNPYNADWTPQNYHENFKSRLEKDPALAAADIAWLDANVGTRFLGEFYESCKGDWAKTINAAKVAWMKDRNLFQRTLVAFFAFLNTGKVEIADDGKGIVDQMYMNPYTIDTVPDVIVMKTDQNDGPFLVYTLEIKGNTKMVKYRIPCGYQPTNVEKVMNITPQQKPSGSSSTKKTTSSTTPTPSTSKTTYKKDPSKSSNTGKNDDPGPGPNTNTGVGSTKSSEEKPSNSNNLPSYSDYKEEIKELKDANSQAPSSANDPTTETPAGAVVDNKGKEEVDAPSSDSGLATGLEGDSNSQEWDGPVD